MRRAQRLDASSRPARRGRRTRGCSPRARRRRRGPGSNVRTVMPAGNCGSLGEGQRHAHLVERPVGAEARARGTASSSLPSAPSTQIVTRPPPCGGDVRDRGVEQRPRRAPGRRGPGGDDERRAPSCRRRALSPRATCDVRARRRRGNRRSRRPDARGRATPRRRARRDRRPRARASSSAAIASRIARELAADRRASARSVVTAARVPCRRWPVPEVRRRARLPSSKRWQELYPDAHCALHAHERVRAARARRSSRRRAPTSASTWSRRRCSRSTRRRPTSRGADPGRARDDRPARPGSSARRPRT